MDNDKIYNKVKMCILRERRTFFSSFHENGSEEKSESQGGTELQILGFYVLMLLPQS